MSERMLGDLFPASGEGTGAGVLNADDINAYAGAIAVNNARTTLVYDAETERIVMDDAINGTLNQSQATAVSLHQNGFASDIDRRLLDKYVYAVQPKPDNVADYIAQLDSAEITPIPDPEPSDIETKRLAITDDILDMLVYQDDKMLELQNIKATSLNDMRSKVETLWGETFTMDNLSVAQLYANMIEGQSTPGSYSDDSGWKQTPSYILERIGVIIGDVNTGLNKAQCEEVRDTYWTPSAITFSDPPTTEEKDRLRMRIWSIPVASGVDFYDNYQYASGGGGGGGDDPSESLIPPDPDSAPTPVEHDGLYEFINGCQSTYQTMFNNAINTNHTNQIITVIGTTGYQAKLNCYEVSGGVWTAVSGLTNIDATVGQDGIRPTSEVQENHYTRSRTPAGAFRLGNYTTNRDDVGAFGIDDKTSSKINYKILTQSMYWIDGSQSQIELYPSWYNTFIDTSENPKHLIQWKRDDWGTVTVYKSDKTTEVNTANVSFEPGKYYASYSGFSPYAKEHLWDYRNTSYRHAIVIRFNMIPHVDDSKPRYPDQLPNSNHPYGANSGSAYFLHSYHTDGQLDYTAGCISIPDPKMEAVLDWIDRSKSPFIFIGL